MTATASDYDILIVGAGISGIGMAAHLQMMCPGRDYAILERRDNLGGTWDLFRYPGIRSDSDMHTLGFSFEPWRHEKSIADGPAILDYLNHIVDERDIRPQIKFGHRVISADFRHGDARWHVVVEVDGERQKLTANWLYLGSGYYDYDEPYDAGFDFSNFDGQVLHPQFWPQSPPEGLDYAGKRVVVIGSGATAVTLVPAMATEAAKVTMLQRTPTWMFSRPARDSIANLLRRILPDTIAYRITRWKNIALQDWSFKKARSQPGKMKAFLKKRIEARLGEDFDDADFSPPYDPWEQRLCLVPDDDLFDAIRARKADVVTGHIDRFVKQGVQLTDGRLLPADIIVTATGLKLAVAGKIAISVEGEEITFADHYYYRGCMFSNVPNFAAVFGYLNASWTLRADIVSEYVCTVLNLMEERNASIATPALSAEEEARLEQEDLFDFSSGYLLRSKHIMPKSAASPPWQLSQNYRKDRRDLKSAPLEDGILKLGHARAAAASVLPMEAAE